MYDDNKHFFSFKKVMCELGADYNQVPLFSLQSISKGFYGEYFCVYMLGMEHVAAYNTALLQLPVAITILCRFSGACWGLTTLPLCWTAL